MCCPYRGIGLWQNAVTKLINGLIPHFVEGGTLSGTTIVNGMNVAQTEMYRFGRTGWFRVPKPKIAVLQYRF